MASLQNCKIYFQNVLYRWLLLHMYKQIFTKITLKDMSTYRDTKSFFDLWRFQLNAIIGLLVLNLFIPF